MSEYINPYTVAETICLIISIIFLLKDSNFVWKSLIIFLFATCSVEIGTIPMKKLYLAHRIPQNSNAWVFNILLIFQILFFSLMFWELLKTRKKSKVAILTCLALLSMLYFFEIINHGRDGIYIYNDKTYSAMSVILIIYSLYYYYILLKSDLHITLKYSANFWWVTGTLFFFFGTTAVNVYYVVLTQVLKINPNTDMTYISYIINALNITLYGCWSYSFICRRWSLNK